MRPSRNPAALAYAGALALLYAASVARGQHSTLEGIDPLDLSMLGAASGQLIAQGEIWRLGTAPLLHVSPGHLVTNLAAILIVGASFERRAGAIWFLLACLLGGFSGALFSMASNPALAVSLGASGSVCALLAVHFVALAREPWGLRRVSETVLTALLLLIALAPVRELAGPDGITDIAAHLGGSAAGLSLGFGLWQSWPSGESRPQHPAAVRAAVATALATLVLCQVYGAWRSETYRSRYAAYVGRPALVAAAASPEALDRLIAAYPRDPRPRIGRAGFDLQAGAYGQARTRLRSAIAEPDLVRDLGPGIAVKATLLLSYASLLDGDVAEARRVAVPVCPYAPLDPSLSELHRDLVAKEICPTPEEESR